MVVAGPLVALLGYLALGPALLVGLVHAAFLAAGTRLWLRLLAMPVVGLFVTSVCLFSATPSHVMALLRGLPIQDFHPIHLMASMTLLPTVVCMGLVEAIHQGRQRVSHVWLEPLRLAHLDELADVLLHPRVYDHIGGTVPSRADFKQHLQRSLAGPPPECADEVWLNWLIRDDAGFRVLGRMEAVAHDGLVEIAILMRPDLWGQGLAQQALARMHLELEARFDRLEVWAATTPANRRCQALLERSGYVRFTGPLPRLFSHDTGDLVYVRGTPRRSASPAR